MCHLKKFAANARCLICGKEKPGVVAEFTDGSLNGFLCFKDLAKQVENRAGSQEQPGNGQVQHAN